MKATAGRLAGRRTRAQQALLCLARVDGGGREGGRSILDRPRGASRGAKRAGWEKPDRWPVGRAFQEDEASSALLLGREAEGKVAAIG